MINLSNISKGFGGKVLFEEACGQIFSSSRIALIGANGAGKTTLVKMILGLDSCDSGSISRANRLSIGHLSQEVPKFSERSVLQEVMHVQSRMQELKTLRKDFEEEFARNPNPSEEDLHRYGHVLEELELLDEFRLEANAKEILDGMGFKDVHKPVNSFSGGWLMRVALSKILLQGPDLLLLDEPTNHLDLESLIWLEEYLSRCKSALLLVSHDTEFLNRLVHEVWEIDQKKLWQYKGNLERYAEQRQMRQELQLAQYEKQQEKIQAIQSFVNRFGAKATKAKQAQSRLKQLEKMDIIELEKDKSRIGFRFPPAPHSGKNVITTEKLCMNFDRPIFRDLEWTIPRGSHVAIVGENGVGKTTLLRLLAGNIPASSGSIKLGHEVKIGYYAQIQAESLDLSLSILQELSKDAPYDFTPQQIRSVAGTFLFTGDDVEKKCRVLSGGERARVALAKLLLTPCNFLLLDEPTNHLDIESKQVLLEALMEFEGTLCLVSHDRAFMSPLVKTVLEIEPGPNGATVHHLVETYDENIERKKNKARLTTPKLAKESSARQVPAIDAEVASDVSRKISPNKKASLQRELVQLEKDIESLEIVMADVTKFLEIPGNYDDQKALRDQLARQERARGELDAKMARWEEISKSLAEN